MCFVQRAIDHVLLKSGPRDGYLVRINPADVPSEISELFIHVQPAGAAPFPTDNPCQWTRAHPTCSFLAPAGWGIGFVVTTTARFQGPGRPWFWTGPMEIILNGAATTPETAFQGGPNNIRVYTTRERPVFISPRDNAFDGAMPGYP